MCLDCWGLVIRIRSTSNVVNFFAVRRSRIDLAALSGNVESRTVYDQAQTPARSRFFPAIVACSLRGPSHGRAGRSAHGSSRPHCQRADGRGGECCQPQRSLPLGFDGALRSGSRRSPGPTPRCCRRGSAGRDELFALAELSFLHAEQTGKQEYYLAAAVYAYALLFPGGAADPLYSVDRRLRTAADLYNRGLTSAFASADRSVVELRGGTRALPFGELTVELDPSGFAGVIGGW